jgi:hypothetical protein
MIIPYDGGEIDFSIPEKYKSVGMKVSGGADSAILCYLLSKYKLEERPDLKIVLVTGVIETRPFQYEKAKAITNKIAELHGVTWQDLFEFHHVFPMTTATIQLEQKEQMTYLFASKKIDLVLWGVTENPPPEVKECWLDGRDHSRDVHLGEKPTWDEDGYNPLVNINKKHVASIYDHFGIREDLFPLTRSCEVDNTYVFTGETTCRRPTCWWCQERKWAFGTYE